MRLLPDEEHSAARRFLVSGSIWLCLATLGGLASAIQLFSPDVLRNIPVLEFGRVRPLHTNLVLFGFVGLMSIGAGLYIAPVMLRTRLHGERLAHLSLWLFPSGSPRAGSTPSSSSRSSCSSWPPSCFCSTS